MKSPLERAGFSFGFEIRFEPATSTNEARERRSLVRWSEALAEACFEKAERIKPVGRYPVPGAKLQTELTEVIGLCFLFWVGKLDSFKRHPESTEQH